MMKRFPLTLILLVLALPPLRAQFRSTLEDLDDSETVRSLKEHVAILSAAQLEGRRAGSEGEAEAAAYLAEKLGEYGIDMLGAGQAFRLAREGAQIAELQ